LLGYFVRPSAGFTVSAGGASSCSGSCINLRWPHRFAVMGLSPSFSFSLSMSSARLPPPSSCQRRISVFANSCLARIMPCSAVSPRHAQEIFWRLLQTLALCGTPTGPSRIGAFHHISQQLLRPLSA
jgi:hypothetical protein